jgi:hypothetical protein
MLRLTHLDGIVLFHAPADNMLVSEDKGKVRIAHQQEHIEK